MYSFMVLRHSFTCLRIAKSCLYVLSQVLTVGCAKEPFVIFTILASRKNCSPSKIFSWLSLSLLAFLEILKSLFTHFCAASKLYLKYLLIFLLVNAIVMKLSICVKSLIFFFRCFLFLRNIDEYFFPPGNGINFNIGA